MDPGHKDGQDEKVSHIRVCGLFIYVKQEWSACTCVSLSPCVCLRKIWLKAVLFRSAEELQGSSFWFRLCLLLHGAAGVCLSSGGNGVNEFFLFLLSLIYSYFLWLDELSWACMAFPLHHILFPFVPQWGVSRGNGNTGLKPLNCQNSRSVGGTSWPCWGQQTVGTAAVSCSALGVGMAEWWAYCMLACWLFTLTHHWSLLLACQCCGMSD